MKLKTGVYFLLIFGLFIKFNIQLRTGLRVGQGGFLNAKAKNLLSKICWLPLYIMLQTNRLSNLSFANIARYSLNLV